MNAEPNPPGAEFTPIPLPEPAGAQPRPEVKPSPPANPIRRPVRGFDPAEKFRRLQPHAGYHGGLGAQAAREHARGRHSS